MDEHKWLLEASWWEVLTVGKMVLALVDKAMFSKSLMQFSADRWSCDNLYAGQKATVRLGHGTMDWFKIGK